MSKLRDYQESAVDAGVAFIKSAGTSKAASNGVIVAPTAAGKSHMIAALADRIGGKVVVMQPTKELLEQNYGKYVAKGLEAAIYSASAGRKEIANVTFCTPGSVKSIGSMFRGCTLIVDECHLFPPNPSSMIGQFMMSAGVKKCIGLTATPFRLDKDELKFITSTLPRMFGSIIHCIQVSEMTSRGYWSPMKYREITFDEMLLRLNSTGSDYTEDSMKAAYEANGIESSIENAVSKAREFGRKSILIFVPSVAAAKELAKRVKGEAVWGDMKADDRERVIADFRSGVTDCVVNVNVLSVGFDHPGVDCIVMARPTRSLAWYYQALGRGTRVDPSGVKKDCWVYDMSGNFSRFGRIENISIENVPGYGWGVFGTAQTRLFTNVWMWDNKVWTRDNCVMLKEYKKRMFASGNVGAFFR